jgi:DNA-binding transcriptional regulator LsrR (DeoR family)
VTPDGRLVDHEINPRVIAIGLDAVSRIPNVVLAGGGRNKIEAIRAALRAVSVQVLITDSETAAALLGKV